MENQAQATQEPQAAKTVNGSAHPSDCICLPCLHEAAARNGASVSTLYPAGVRPPECWSFEGCECADCAAYAQHLWEQEKWDAAMDAGERD